MDSTRFQVACAPLSESLLLGLQVMPSIAALVWSLLWQRLGYALESSLFQLPVFFTFSETPCCSAKSSSTVQGQVLYVLSSMLLHLFLIALSVLPGRCLRISAHLFPSFLCASISILSSSSLQGSFLIAGSKWKCHLFQHWSRVLCGNFSLANRAQPPFFNLFCETHSTSIASSSAVQM